MCVSITEKIPPSSYPLWIQGYVLLNQLDGHQKKWTEWTKYGSLSTSPAARLRPAGTTGVILVYCCAQQQRRERQHTEVLFSRKMRILQLSPYSCIRGHLGSAGLCKVTGDIEFGPENITYPVGSFPLNEARMRFPLKALFCLHEVWSLIYRQCEKRMVCSWGKWDKTLSLHKDVTVKHKIENTASFAHLSLTAG